MHPRGLFVAIWLASAGAMLAPLVASADENLPAKREACHMQARQQIKAPYKGVDLYRFMIERCQVYLCDRVARVPNEEITTGSVGSSPIPVPPRRPASPRK